MASACFSFIFTGLNGASIYTTASDYINIGHIIAAVGITVFVLHAKLDSTVFIIKHTQAQTIFSGGSVELNSIITDGNGMRHHFTAVKLRRRASVFAVFSAQNELELICFIGRCGAFILPVTFYRKFAA